MRVLITGGTGAIGRFVVEELRERGHEPVVLSRGIVAPDASLVGVQQIRGDTRQLDDMIAAIERSRSERIIHLAALLLECEDEPYLGFQINSLGMTTVLEAARRTGVQRVVYGSTKSVFGAITGAWAYPSYRPVREDHPRRARSMYGLSKLIGEQTAEYYRRRFGLDVIITRFGTTCGPGKGERHGSSRVPGDIIENAVLGRPAHVPRGGDERDDIIYNRELARGLVLACLAADLKHHVFHLGTGALITLHDLARAVRASLPGAEITIGPGLDYMGLGMGNYCRMSTTRAARELGFTARLSVEEWVADYIAVFRQTLAAAPAAS